MEPIQPMQPIRPPMATKSQRWWMWIVVVAVIIVFAYLLWQWYGAAKLQTAAPAGTQPSSALSAGDTTGDIQKDLGSVDLGNIDQEVNQLNEDINKL